MCMYMYNLPIYHKRSAYSGMYMYMHECMYTYTHVHIYKHMCVCIYVCIYGAFMHHQRDQRQEATAAPRAALRTAPGATPPHHRHKRVV